MSDFEIQIVQSWGIASARHTSGCTVPLPSQATTHSAATEFLFDAPLGPSIVRWDIVNQTRVLQFQAHRDLVTCMRASPDKQLVATSCHSGGVRLWSRGWECVGDVTAPMASQHHLAWSHDSKRFLIVGNGVNSSVVMYAVQLDSGKPVLKQLWQVKAREEVKGQRAEVNVERSIENVESEVSDVLTENTAKYYKYKDAFYMAEINPSGNTVAVKEREAGSMLVQLLSVEGKLLKSAELRLDGTDKKLDAILMSTYSKGHYAVAVQGGNVFIIAAETLDVVNLIKPGYTSRTCAWDGDNLVLPSDSGKLVWWSPSGEKQCEFKVGSADFIVRLDWSVSSHALWMCGFSSLNYLEVKRDDKGSVIGVSSSHVIHSYDITCCGVAFSPSGRSLASGDLAGNVWVMQSDDIKPIHKCSVGMSVRCLVWRGEEEVVIGCLDGLVHRWVVGTEPSVMFAMDGNIIHMRWDHTHKRLAVGSSKGVLGVYDMSQDFICPQAVFTAHHPRVGTQDMRFGQLTRQAEIWSACWSPEDTLVATCSEDQTTKIWKVENWQCVTTLYGHTMAVTSVDWKRVGGASLLATCSDDREIGLIQYPAVLDSYSTTSTTKNTRNLEKDTLRPEEVSSVLRGVSLILGKSGRFVDTIRLIDGERFELLNVLNTKDIYGWHTLTYLAFDPGLRNVPTTTGANSHVDSPLLMVTTQNGHVVAWDVLSGRRMTQGRLHCGSIEGLAWDGTSKCIATVGGDCVVHMFKLNARLEQ